MGLTLTYYIFEGVLIGPGLHIDAYSGGGAGSTRNRPARTANNPYSTHIITHGSGRRHVHGGPLPPGRYEIATPRRHAHLGLSAQLSTGRAAVSHRDGFYIHGRGPHGSDGCIVPVRRSDFDKLMQMLKASSGGTLVVCEAMGDMGFA